VTRYAVVFADLRTERDFAKELKKLPRHDQQAIYDEIKELANNPHPHGTRIKPMLGFSLQGYVVTHRLRVGNYRIFYELNEETRRVVLLALRRRSERTYD
jgi:mRNA interferase RelE/StbE